MGSRWDQAANPAGRSPGSCCLTPGSRHPQVLAEGRRVIANIERVAKLFVTKTVYAAVLAVVVGVAGVPFPFFPRHLTIVSTAAIGIPGIALRSRVRRFESCWGRINRTRKLIASFGDMAPGLGKRPAWPISPAARAPGAPQNPAGPTPPDLSARAVNDHQDRVLARALHGANPPEPGAQVAAKIHLWRRPTTAGLSRDVFAHGRSYPPDMRVSRWMLRGPLVVREWVICG